MDYIYTLIGAFTIWVALFSRELLVNRTSFKVVLGISIALFSAGLLLHYQERGKYSMAGALLYPLISLGLYRFGRWFFVRRFNREPRDTFLSWAQGMTDDRIFNVVYFAAAFGGLILFTAAIGKLAEAGW